MLARWLQRCGLLIAITMLLAAPELISLARYSHLYYFVHYQDYADFHAYFTSSVQAVGGPAFVLGIAGFALAALPGCPLDSPRGRDHARDLRRWDRDVGRRNRPGRDHLSARDPALDAVSAVALVHAGGDRHRSG